MPANKTNTLGVINYPNVKGAACGFDVFGYNLNAVSGYSLPNNPNYDLWPMNAYAAHAGKDTTVCKDSSTTVMLGSPPVAGLVYRWYPVKGLSDTAVAQPTVQPDSSIWYYLTVTDTTGASCMQRRTDSVHITVQKCNTVGVGEVTNPVHDYHLRPNLYKDDFTALITIGDHEQGEVMIYGMDGKLIGRHKVTDGINTLSLVGDGLTAGVYFYKVYIDGESKSTGKLVVVH